MFLSEDEEMVVEDLPIEGFNKSDNCRTYATQSLASNAIPQLSQHLSFQKLSSSPLSSTDNSLGQSIVAANAQLLRKALLKYLKNCVGQHSNGILISSNCSSYPLPISTGYDDQDSVLESLVLKNKLLDRVSKELLTSTFQEFSEIGEFFKQIKEIIGTTTAYELVYLIAVILKAKLEGFREMEKQQMMELIPKMQRFWGEQKEEEFGGSGWEVYEDTDQAVVKKFAGAGVEQLASKVYFSPQLKFLSLRQLGLSASKVMDKFTSFACFCSKLVFLSMSGMVCDDSELQEFGEELKFQTGQDGKLQNSLLTKKIKLS